LEGGVAQFQVRLSAPAPAAGLRIGYRTSGLLNSQGSVQIEPGQRSGLIAVPLAQRSMASPRDLVVVLEDLPAGYRLSDDLGAARVSVVPLGSDRSVLREAALEASRSVLGTERNDLLQELRPGTAFASQAGSDRILLRPHGQAPAVLLDFDPRSGDRLQLLRSDVPDLKLADLLVINGRLQWGDQVLALLRGPEGTIPFLRDVSALVELVEAPTPAPADAPRPEPNSKQQSVLAGTAEALQLNGPATRVTLTPAPLQPIQPGDALIWSGSGLSLSSATGSPRLVELRVEQAALLATQQLSLMLYRTDAEGRPLAADGRTPVASPQQAVIAQIGAVPDDAGRILFAGGSSAVLLSPGQQLRGLLLQGNSPLPTTPPLQVETSGTGLTIRLGADLLVLRAELSLSNSVDQRLELARRAGFGELLYLEDQELVDVQLLSSCANTNTLAFLKVDIATDSASGQPRITVAGQPVSNTAEFRQFLLQHLDPGFRVAQGGSPNLATRHVWSVSSGTGFYTPVMLSQSGEVFLLGSALNRDGRVHLRGIGDGAYAFEDLAADQGSDFDFNDGVLVVQRRSATGEAASFVSASGSGAIDLGGAAVLQSASNHQLIRTSGVAANVLTLAGFDVVVLRQGWQADRISLAGGNNLIAMGRQGAGGSLSLGGGQDVLLVGLGTLTTVKTERPDRVSGFDPAHDRLLLVGEGRLDLQATAAGILLSLDGRPLLMLEGVNDQRQLSAAIERDRPNTGDLIARIQARGVLTVALPANRPGVSERDANGIWRGTSVDLVRSIAEQLLGSADRVLFAEPGEDGELREALRSGHLDLALLTGDPLAADLAGDGDRSWTLPDATPDGDLTFLLPNAQTLFRQTVNRILQSPLKAELLGLTAASLPAAVGSSLTTAQQRLLDLQASGESSTAGQGTPLRQGFVRGVLDRLGNAAELWNRFFPGAPRPAVVLSHPLDLPVYGPALTAELPSAAVSGDALAEIAVRGVLRVAVAGGGSQNLQLWQRQLLEALIAQLGGGGSAPVLQLLPYATAAEGLGLLSGGKVDLLLPDRADSSWLDGVVGVDSVDLENPNPVQLLMTQRSGIHSLDDLGGTRLGFTAGAQVEAALRQRLASSGTTASLSSFPSLTLASDAMRLGQLDGLVVEGGAVQALRDRLANIGIATELLVDPLLPATGQILLAPNQSRLRDALQVAAAVVQSERPG
jgi:ABC-type amino acid transport substrate-binding protein